MTFNPITEPVDHILLAGRKSPGLATVRGAGIAGRWDERRLYAAGGAFVVYRGQKLAKFTVTLRLYTEQHWTDWHDWRPLVQTPPPPSPEALDRQMRTAQAAQLQLRTDSDILAASPLLGNDPAFQERLRTLTRQANATPSPLGPRPRAKDIWHPILEDLGIRSVVIEAVLQPQQTADGEWSIEIKMIEYRPPQLALTGIEGSDDVEPQNENERRIASQDAQIRAIETEIQTERDRRAREAS